MEIVDAVRGMDISLADLATFLKSAKADIPTSGNQGAPTKPDGFVGRGGATERADFGSEATEEAERSLQRRGPKSAKPTPTETEDIDE